MARENLARLHADDGVGERRFGPARHFAHQSRQVARGRLEQGLPLAAALVGEQRIVASHQAFARKRRRGDFGQMLLVEQRQLPRTQNAEVVADQ